MGAGGSHLLSWLLRRLRSGGLRFEAQPGQIVSGDLISKITRSKWTGSKAHQCEALNPNPSPTRREKEK
jgi:hypothetical protein